MPPTSLKENLRVPGLEGNGSQLCKYFGSCFYSLEGPLTRTDNTGQFSVFIVDTPLYFSIQALNL